MQISSLKDVSVMFSYLERHDGSLDDVNAFF